MSCSRPCVHHNALRAEHDSFWSRPWGVPAAQDRELSGTALSATGWHGQKPGSKSHDIMAMVCNPDMYENANELQLSDMAKFDPVTALKAQPHVSGLSLDQWPVDDG